MTYIFRKRNIPTSKIKLKKFLSCVYMQKMGIFKATTEQFQLR